MKHEIFQISQLQLLPSLLLCSLLMFVYRVSLNWRCHHLHTESQCPVHNYHILFSFFVLFFFNSWNHSLLWIIKAKLLNSLQPYGFFSHLNLVFVLNGFGILAYSTHPKMSCCCWIITNPNVSKRVVNGKTGRWKLAASGKWALEKPSIGRCQLCPNA